MESVVAAGLEELGLSRGDHVLVTSDVRYMRLPKDGSGRVPDYAEALLDGLLECVGDSGTVVVLSFSAAAVTPRQRRGAAEFTRDTPSSSGGLVRALLARDDALRSSHPTNSFAAIGSRAADLVRFHTPESYTFRPVEDLVNYGGKQLVLGCVDTVPGFSMVHLAQFHLGLSRRNLLAGRVVAKYRDPWGRLRTFHKDDIPGCSLGFGKLYERYRAAGVLREGRVARAPSVLIGARECYSIADEALREDPRCVLCDDPACLDCRMLKTYSTGGRWAFTTAKVRDTLNSRAARV